MTSAPGEQRNALEVRPLQEEETQIWEALVSSSPQATVFHSTAWKSVIEQAYGTGSFLQLACFDGAKLVGGCTALLRRKFGVPEAVMPLQTPYGGYVLHAELAEEKASTRALRTAEILSAMAAWMGRSFVSENLICAPGLEDARPLSRAGYTVSPRYTYTIDLGAGSDLLWDRFESSVRRQIRKAERLSPTPTALDVGTAHRLLSSTFERRGGRCPVSPELVEAILTSGELAPSREVRAVTLDGELASFLVLLHHGRTVSYALAATAPEKMATGVSSWMVWKALESKSQPTSGWTTFDFLGANIPSIARFKDGFAPELRHYWRLDRQRGALGRALTAARRLRDL